MRLDPLDRDHCQECGQSVVTDPNIGAVYHPQTMSEVCPAAPSPSRPDLAAAQHGARVGSVAAPPAAPGDAAGGTRSPLDAPAANISGAEVGKHAAAGEYGHGMGRTVVHADGCCERFKSSTGRGLVPDPPSVAAPRPVVPSPEAKR